MPHPEHAVEDLTGPGTDGLGFFTSLAARRLRMSPTTLYRRVAVAEAITWALLLLGMFLKYVTETTELVVRICGMVHGAVFIAYCLTTVLVWIDQRWSLRAARARPGRAVPPFVTVPFERYAERRGLLRTSWRLRDAAPAGPLEQLAVLAGAPAAAGCRPSAWPRSPRSPPSRMVAGPPV